jgi:lipopolysaccharide export system ATP-binding protein
MTPDPTRPRPDLRATWLVKAYQEHDVVTGASLAVRRGEVIALLGPNGAGKTTLLSMLIGILRPDAGQIEIDGVDVTDLPIHARAQLGLSYLPQEPSVFRGLSVEDNILLYLETFEPDRRRRAQRLDGLLAEFDLSDIRRQNAARLSGGQRRRCEIARALAAEPSYMLLDEPFAGVDPLAVSNIQQTIHALRARDIGVLVSDHNVRETLSIVDRAYVMVAGGIIAHGEPAGIIADENVRRFYLGNSLDR